MPLRPVESPRKRVANNLDPQPQQPTKQDCAPTHVTVAEVSKASCSHDGRENPVSQQLRPSAVDCKKHGECSLDFDVYNLPFNRHLFLRHIKAKLLKRRPNHVGPIKDPWDVLIDPKKNVLKHREQLCNDARTSSVSHWGPNCATFTRAREIEMPGVPNAPKPLRSNAYPEGLPEVLDQARHNAHGKNHQKSAACDRRHRHGEPCSRRMPSCPSRRQWFHT